MTFSVPRGTDGAAVTTYTPTSLILLPQAVDDGSLVVDVTFNGQTYRASLALPAVIADGTTTHSLQAGYAYTYTVTVKNTGLEVSEAEIKDWQTDGKEDERKGDADLLGPAHVGDYYYADGSYSSTLDDEKEVIGLVFHVGRHANDHSDYSATGIWESNYHGYAMALTDVYKDKVRWLGGNYASSEYRRYIGTESVDDDNFAQGAWSGYSDTQMLKALVDKENAAPRTVFPAAEYCLTYGEDNTAYRAPKASSDWFMPSISQLWQIYDNREKLSANLRKLQKDSKYAAAAWLAANYYWSSSEYGPGVGSVVRGIQFSEYGGLVALLKNNNTAFVRPVLAF